MGLIPSKAIDRVQFYENKETGWASVATQIGTTTAAITDLTTKTAAARAAYDAQQAAKDAAQTATQAWQQAVVAMSIAGAAIIDQVRAKAKTSGDGIWTLANLPAPATPARVGPPGTPFQLEVALKPSGALELTWKCNNPAGSQGTLYQMGRKVDDATTWEYLGGAGAKTYVDNTLPAGTSKVTYQIQGVRTTAVGDAAEFVVNIGTTSAGAMTASVTQGPPKLAA